MIFDTHTDVLFDIINNHHNLDYHLKEMSNYKGAVLNYYFKGNESYDSFLFVLKKIKEFYRKNFKILEKHNFVLGVEGLGPLKKLSDLDLLLDSGIKVVTLTWNDKNLLATGTYTNKKRGLTDFGRCFLDKLISTNIILDLSHLNNKSFKDIIKYYKGNVIVSHSNVKTLCNNERNLSDYQLSLIKSKNILVGVNSYKNFVGQKKNLDSFINVIDYLYEKVGINHICLGLDFDYYLPSTINSDSIDGLQYPRDLINLKNKLLEKGYSIVDIEKLFFKNAILYFKSTLIL
ncbi:MAG: membrane dipeptidase [Erysipelotrichales bacterium]|nr:membrane dipeptidase [Erysipelotrichales bacterium]